MVETLDMLETFDTLVTLAFLSFCFAKICATFKVVDKQCKAM